MSKKEIAESFLKLASSGQVREAFAWHAHSLAFWARYGIEGPD